MELLARQSARLGDRVWLRFLGDGEPESAGFTEMFSAACRTASGLRRAGLRPGDRVLLMLPDSRQFLEVFFGALVAGGIPVPLSPPFSLRKLDAYSETAQRIVRDCGARFCVSTGKIFAVLAASLRSGNAVTLLTPADVRAEAPYPAAPVGGEALAFIQYTSGSTSAPSGVALTHRNLLKNVEAIASTLELTEHDVGVSWLPLYHDMGLIGTLLTTLYAGSTLVLITPASFLKDPALWLKAISQYGASLSVAPNFAFALCLKRLEDEDLAGIRLDSLRAVLNGAEPIDHDVVQRFVERFKAYGLREGTVVPVYGLAEATLAVTFSPPGEYVIDRVDADRLEGEGVAVPASASGRGRRLVSVGAPLPFNEVRIVDEAGRTLKERRVGEIVVRGASVMRGYYNDPGKTARSLRDGWLYTGDLGYFTDGRLFVAGRRKDVIIRHGKNYHPQDIEGAVAKLDGVRTGCVAAFGYESDGRECVGIVAETHLRREAERGELEAAVIREVSRAFNFRPDAIALVPPRTIPKTSSGKLRRAVCKDLFLSRRLDGRRWNALVVTSATLRSAAVMAATRLAGYVTRAVGTQKSDVVSRVETG